MPERYSRSGVEIYAKLGLTGDAKSKRQQLIDQWHAKP